MKNIPKERIEFNPQKGILVKTILRRMVDMEPLVGVKGL
jgi:hypothetical protein